MGKFVVVDDTEVQCVEAVFPRDAASIVAKSPVIPDEANPDRGLVILSVYKWSDGVDEALAALPGFDEKASYCQEKLELLADYAKPRQ